MSLDVALLNKTHVDPTYVTFVHYPRTSRPQMVLRTMRSTHGRACCLSYWEGETKTAHSIRNIPSKKRKPKNRNFTDRIKSAIFKLILEQAILGSAALFWRNWSHARNGQVALFSAPVGSRAYDLRLVGIQANVLQLPWWGPALFFGESRGQG